jgi:hypothetical protein
MIRSTGTHARLIEEWLLTERERDNPATRVPAWSDGNHAEALIHGES